MTFSKASVEHYNRQCDTFGRCTINRLLDVEAVQTGVCNTCLEKRKAKASSKSLLPFVSRPQRPVRNSCAHAVCILHSRVNGRKNFENGCTRCKKISKTS